MKYYIFGVLHSHCFGITRIKKQINKTVDNVAGPWLVFQAEHGKCFQFTHTLDALQRLRSK
jgi:hypothetical protein